MRRGFTLLEFVVVLVVIAVISAILWPTCMGSGKRSVRRMHCQSNLKQISLGFNQYFQDYDRRFLPSQSSSKDGWADVLQPYTKSWAIFQCSENGTGRDTNLTDYFYNARLSKLGAKNVLVPSSTIIFGDGSVESPSSTAISELPKNWSTDENSPASRHIGGANYAFADGHVKWLRAENVTLNISSWSAKSAVLQSDLCHSNLNQIVMGFKHYVQDYDLRFPPVQTNSNTGWADLLQPYVKTAYGFQCPTNQTGGEPNSTDYFYNARLAKAGYWSILIPEATILAGDGNFNSLENTAFSAFPEPWLSNEKSPACRHGKGANYIFADGHAEWLKPKYITSHRPNKSGVNTFLVR